MEIWRKIWREIWREISPARLREAEGSGEDPEHAVARGGMHLGRLLGTAEGARIDRVPSVEMLTSLAWGPFLYLSAGRRRARAFLAFAFARIASLRRFGLTRVRGCMGTRRAVIAQSYRIYARKG